MEKSYEIDLKSFAEDLEVDITDLRDLFIVYINEMKEEIIAVNKMLQEGNWLMLQRTAHNIKGVSLNLNLHEMFEAADKLDKCLKSGKMHEAFEHAADITAAYEATKSNIAAAFKKHGYSIIIE
ncbi:MAG: Hpt domain-containing protein [Bacillota bacterium]